MRTVISGATARHLDFDIGKMLFGIFLFMSLFLLVDPFYTGYGAFRVTRDLGPLKYFGLLFGLAAAFLTVAGQAIFLRPAEQPPWRQALFTAWPLLLISLMVLAGSITARLYLDIKETFLQLAVGFVGLPLAAIMFWGERDSLRAVRRFFLGLLLVMPIVIGWIAYARVQGGQAFHTEIFLFVPLGVYFFLAIRQKWLAWCILLTAIALGIASHKNTSYLIVLFVVAHLLLLALVAGRQEKYSVKRMLAIYCLAVITLIGIAVIIFLLVKRDVYLPSGNVEVRLITYKAALIRFYESPLWGTAFLDTTQVELHDRVILGMTSVITHSDLLDLLSHGGMVTALLFIWGFARIGKKVANAFRIEMHGSWRAAFHGLVSIVVCGLVAAAFNSPLISLPIAVLFWFAVGLLIAISDYALLHPDTIRDSL